MVPERTRFPCNGPLSWPRINHVGPAAFSEKCKQLLSGEIQHSKKMEERTEDEFCYADEVQDRSATFVGGYDENNAENNNSQSEIEEFIKAQKTDNTR